MNRAKRTNRAALAGFVCLAFLLTVQSVNSPVSKNYAYSDYAVYQYVAQIMSEGGMPYRDTFDHKGPAFYLLNELGYVLHSGCGMWIIDFLLMLGTVACAYSIVNRILNGKMSFFIVAVVLSGISAWGYWIGNTPESCILFFLMMAMYLFTEYMECRSLTHLQIMLLGFAGAFALMTKPTFLAMFAVLIAEVLYETLRSKDFIFLKRCLIWFSVTFFGCIAVLVGWLYRNGALAECINQYVIFNIRYGSAAGNSIWDAARIFLERRSTILGLFCLWIIYARRSEYTDRMKQLLVSAGAAWMLVFCVSVMPGRGYQQYTLVYYPMILVLVAAAWKDIDHLFEEGGWRRITGITAAALLAVTVLLPNVKDTMVNIMTYTAEQEVKEEVVRYLQSVPGEYEIAVVSPDDNWLYLQTAHRSATKYSYTQADLIYENVQTDFIAEYAAALDQNRPRFIVENSNSRLYSGKIAGNTRTEYDKVFENNNYIVYELGGDEDGRSADG